MENQEKNDKGENKGYTPEANNDIGKNESREPTQNLKWDQAQRRQQAGPRSYNESLEIQNITNQNTEAQNEQIDYEGMKDPNDPKDIGDQISERQQTVDEKDAPRDQGKDRNRNK